MENGMLLRRSPLKLDESLPGYIVRLADENGYETPSWVLVMAGIRNPSSGYSFLFGDAVDLRPLSGLTGAPVEELGKLVYPPAGKGGKTPTYLAFGSVIPRHLIRVDRATVCPGCLTETGHARRIWELAPVTACPLHERLLLDTCPNCKRRISWARGKLSSCSCGCDWRDAAARPAGGTGLRLTRLIHERCGLPANGEKGKEDHLGNPLYGLDLHHLLTAVIFIAGQERVRKGGSERSGLHTLANNELHETLSSAFEVFESWPDNFHQFLDGIRAQADGTPATGGLHRSFGRFYPGLYRRLSSRGFDFMRGAFEDYLATRWDGGLIHSKYKNLLPSAFRNNRYVGKCEAARKLSVSSETINRFVEKGLLRGTAKPSGTRRVFRIERSSLDALRTKKGELLSAKQAAGLLRVDRKAVADLVAHGCLTPLQNPSSDGSSKCAFKRQDVEGLLAQICDCVSCPECHTRKGMIDFRHAARSLTFVGCGTGRFVQEILGNNIRPAGMGLGSGLPRFLFDEEQISRYIRDQLLKRREGLLSVRDAARALDMKESEIHAMARIGILPAAEPPGNRTPSALFNLKAIEEFKSRYVFAAELARDRGTTPRFLLRLIAAKGVVPVAGRTDDIGVPYLYRRADLEPLNIREMVAAAHRADRPKRKRQTRLLSTAQTADFLGIAESRFRKLVQRGDLNPWRRRGRDPGRGVPWRFSQFDVERYKLRRMDARDLVSSHEAAALLGDDLSWFYKKWVRTGRLAEVEFKDKLGKHFFRQGEVEKMVEFKKSTVTGPEAARILGMHRTAILKMNRKGKLRAVSGPDVDGFGIHLYLRHEVESIRSALREGR